MQVCALIRTDLGMTKGKICAQTAHAVLGLYRDLQNLDPVAFAQWASLEFP
jgi:peptidyl-tRNA hydrolase